MILKEDINPPLTENEVTVDLIDWFNIEAPNSPIILAILLFARDGHIKFFKETALHKEIEYPELLLYSYEGEEAVKYLDEHPYPFFPFPWEKPEDNSKYTRVGFCLTLNVNPYLVDALIYMRKVYDDVDTDTGMSICRTLTLFDFTIFDNRKFDYTFFGERYKSEDFVTNFPWIYTNAYERLCRNNQQTADFSGFFGILVDIPDCSYVYIPYANSILLSCCENHEFVSYTKDFTSMREYIMDILHPRYYRLTPWESMGPPSMFVGSCNEFFSQSYYEYIICDVPDNEYMTRKIFDKMFELDYKEGYLFVQPHVLGDYKYSQDRRFLLESGRLAWVMSLPELKGTQRALLCFKTEEKYDAPIMIDAFSFHNLNADTELPEERAVVETAKFFREVMNGLNETEMYKPLCRDDIPDDYVLNPKYYICPKPTIEGQYEYVKLSELITRKDIDKIAVDVPYRRYQFSTAPKNAFEITSGSFYWDEACEMAPVVSANVLVDYMDSVSEKHRYIYWTDADEDLDSTNAILWDVNTQLINPEYLVWQLYRKELFLQIASKESFSCDSALYDQTTGMVLDLLIPVPKGSIEIQKQLYEEARKQHIARYEDFRINLEKHNNDNRSSVVSSIFLTDEGIITFPEYECRIPIRSMFTSVYLFLLKKVEGGLEIRDKDIHDYSYEITRIYHAISQKLNRYTDVIRGEEYKEIKEFLLSEDFRSKRSGFNRSIEKVLKPLTTQYKTYMIPKGNGKKRNIEIPAKLICESGNKRWDDLFSTPSHPNSYYPQVEELERWIRETDKAKKSGRELPDDVKRHISLF